MSSMSASCDTPPGPGTPERERCTFSSRAACHSREAMRAARSAL
jgi:hypothetical protein